MTVARNKITVVPFDGLSLRQLYDVLALRQEVFCVEQNCPYQDADGLDMVAWHVLLHDSKGCLQAYARVLPPGTVYGDEASIGRVVSAPQARGAGYGWRVMQAAIELCENNWPSIAVTLSAQSYLHEFYRRLGFENTGDFYLEDDIPHQKMRRGRKAAS